MCGDPEFGTNPLVASPSPPLEGLCPSEGEERERTPSRPLPPQTERSEESTQR
jgi:hypothetical protein